MENIYSHSHVIAQIAEVYLEPRQIFMMEVFLRKLHHIS